MVGSDIPGDLSTPTPDDPAAALAARIAELEAALKQIESWADVYPLKAFPEPDLRRCHDLLRHGGESMDYLSAYIARHIIKSIGTIIDDALGE